MFLGDGLSAKSSIVELWQMCNANGYFSSVSELDVSSGMCHGHGVSALATPLILLMTHALPPRDGHLRPILLRMWQAVWRGS